MRGLLTALGMLLAGALFGLAVAAIEPYPYAHDVQVFAISSLAFVVVAILLRRPDARAAWGIFGIATSVCFFLISLWYWQGTMKHGWWFPSRPHIIERFFAVGGEAAPDAAVSNLFLVVWVGLTVALAAGYVVHRKRRNAA